MSKGVNFGLSFREGPGGRNILSINPFGWVQLVSDIRITPDFRCLYFNIYSRFRPGIKG
jgi:hypothetical protein